MEQKDSNTIISLDGRTDSYVSKALRHSRVAAHVTRLGDKKIPPNVLGNKTPCFQKNINLSQSPSYHRESKVIHTSAQRNFPMWAQFLGVHLVLREQQNESGH